jgi:hypothetical protein
MRIQLLVACWWLLLTSCATSADVATTISQPLDSTLVHQAQASAARVVVQRLSTGRIKFKGPVTIQLGGTGNSASATAADKAKAPVAAGPAAVANDGSRKATNTPWYVFAGLGLGALAGGYLLRGKLL